MVHGMISVVLPVHNGEQFLSESIDSILNQTFTGWELILVNDCSTDMSLSIMEEYAKKDTRIKVIDSKVNLKLPAALNRGFREAKGEYLTWTSDDNMYRKNAFEQMYNYMVENPETGLVYADFDYIDEEKKYIHEQSIEPENIYWGDCVGACFLYKQEVLESVGEYDTDFFLVEDYEYWIRISKKYKVRHLKENLYRYRVHNNSLTGTRRRDILFQNSRLRLKHWDYIIGNVGTKKDELFLKMVLENREQYRFLKRKFWGTSGLPNQLKWLEENGMIDTTKKVILFGAGKVGKQMLDFFDEGQVAYFSDNNTEMIGNYIDNTEVISFQKMVELSDQYQIVISVGPKTVGELAEQLKEAGIDKFIWSKLLLEDIKRPKNGNVDYLECSRKALDWVHRNSIENEGIIVNSNERVSYPEVTGYYIPTLIRWGERELAATYAEWLCSVQSKEGGWYDPGHHNLYVFDTAQILKGLIAAKELGMSVDENIKKGCDWLLDRINEEGRLVPYTENACKPDEVCSELIHLYCLSPLAEAAKIYEEPRYSQAAKKVAHYYISNYKDEILNFGFLSHFYAYVMEALCDIGETELAKEAMKNMEKYQNDEGMIPGFSNVSWTCSTGMFQLAIVWYKLGDLEHGNRTMEYAMKLQNVTGGWNGSYPTVDNLNINSNADFPTYFEASEISWAVKYFLDSMYYKCQLEFETQAPIFKSTLSKEDGRYQAVLGAIKKLVKGDHAKILDIGCGKGCYLKNLLEDMPYVKYCAVDLSERVMRKLPLEIEKKQGSLTDIPYPDEYFDVVYTTEALEHSIFVDNAVREVLRVTKKGGSLIVIDKNSEALGTLEIDDWEQWFSNWQFEEIAENNNCSLNIIENISYEEGRADGLFNAWILTRD